MSSGPESAAFSPNSPGQNKSGLETEYRTGYWVQYRRILNNYISVETDRLCVVGKLDAKYGPRFTPENVCYDQIETLSMGVKLSLYPHVTLLTHNLWYRILTIHDAAANPGYTPCSLLASCFIVAYAAVGGRRFNEGRSEHVVSKLMDHLLLSGETRNSEQVKNGCVYIVERLGFYLFEPTVLHMIDALIQLDAFPDARTLDQFSKTGEPAYPIFYQLLLYMFAEPRFMCLPPSLQAAGLLKYLDLWNKNCSLYLRRSDDEAMNAARLLYYGLGYMRFKVQKKFEIDERFDFTQLRSNHRFAVNNISAEDGTNEEITGMIDQIFGQICDFCALGNTPSRLSEIGDLGSKYTVVRDVDKFASQFTEIRNLGQGSFGTVQHVIENATGAAFAMKTMNMRMSDTDFFFDLQNMTHEFAATQYLGSHRGIIDIVKMYRIGDWGEIRQLVCLYKESFKDTLKQNEPLAFYKSVIRGFLLGLQEIHERGLVHCDIKSSNILVDDNMQTVVADLGMLFFPPSTTFSDQIYTYMYRAPEVSMDGYVSWQSDMWAVGVVLVEILFAAIGVDFFRTYNEIVNDVLSRRDPVFYDHMRQGRRTVYDIKPHILAEINASIPGQEKVRSFGQYNYEYVPLFHLIQKLLIPISRDSRSEKRPSAAECLRHIFFN